MTISFNSDDSLSVGVWEESSLLVQECNSSSIQPGIVSINRKLINDYIKICPFY
jgi:hypothetical protein